MMYLELLDIIFYIKLKKTSNFEFRCPNIQQFLLFQYQVEWNKALPQPFYLQSVQAFLLLLITTTMGCSTSDKYLFVYQDNKKSTLKLLVQAIPTQI